MTVVLCTRCIFNWKRDRHQKSFLNLWKYIHAFNWLMPQATCCWLIEMLWSQKQGEVIKTRWQVLSNSVWTWNKPKTNLKQKRFNGNVTVIKYNWDFVGNSNSHKCSKKKYVHLTTKSFFLEQVKVRSSQIYLRVLMSGISYWMEVN